MICLQLGRHRRHRRARRPASRRRAPLRTTMLNLPQAGVLVGEVVAEVGAAALLALERGARDRLGDREQVAQVERRVPAGVVLAVAAARARAARALAQLREPVERAAPSRPRVRTMPTRSCIIVLQVVLDLVRAFVAAPPARSNGASARRARRLDLRRRRPCRRRARCAKLRRVLAGALAEHQQVGERVAAQPVGAVQPARRTRRRRTARAPSTSACRRRRARRPSCSAWSGRPPSAPW